MDVDEHDDMAFEDNILKGLSGFAIKNRSDETYIPFNKIPQILKLNKINSSIPLNTEDSDDSEYKRSMASIINFNMNKGLDGTIEEDDDIPFINSNDNNDVSLSNFQPKKLKFL